MLKVRLPISPQLSDEPREAGVVLVQRNHHTVHTQSFTIDCEDHGWLIPSPLSRLVKQVRSVFSERHESERQQFIPHFPQVWNNRIFLYETFFRQLRSRSSDSGLRNPYDPGKFPIAFRRFLYQLKQKPHILLFHADQENPTSNSTSNHYSCGHNVLSFSEARSSARPRTMEAISTYGANVSDNDLLEKDAFSSRAIVK
jgi:hypothetical protein